MTLQPKWWQSGAIYQIYPRSFKDSNGDGIGDIPGIISRLDYLKNLGIGAIWLSPFFKSPMADYGYDVADYCDVDPMFGTLADFDELVKGAHQRGIKLIIDFVPNHSSNQHQWFLESRSSKDNPKRDWYIWRDPKPDGSPPNNWGGAFGGSAWTFDEATGQYYFHQFMPEQPDLNWRNPAVKEAMLDALHFWLKRGVDGFRMDVVYMIWKHPDMPDQPLQEGAVPRGPGDIHATQQHIYDWDYEGVHDIMREFRVLADSYGDTVLVGEIWLGLERWASYFGTADAPEFQLPFNFRLILPEVVWNAETIRAEIEQMERIVPPHGYPNYVLNSHDQKRLPSRIGHQYTRIAAMLLLTLRGTPTIYNGEELGLPNGEIEAHQMKDPQGINLGVEHTRDVARTPFLWDESAYAGFSTVEPWLPVHKDYATLNAVHQAKDPDSVLALYQRLLALRKQEAALSIGTYTSLETPQGILGYRRTHKSSTFDIYLNFTTSEHVLSFGQNSRVILATHHRHEGQTSDTLRLGGFEGVVVREV
jgi:alpha-glucosidase